MRVKPPGRATPGGCWPPPAWVDGGQILKEYVPLSARKLGLFRDGETVSETGEDVELLWMFGWTGMNSWAEGLRHWDFCESCAMLFGMLLKEFGLSKSAEEKKRTWRRS